MSLDRRTFLKQAAVGLSAFLVPGARPTSALPGSGSPVLVAVFLRGAIDPLNTVVPHGDPSYYALRPTLQIPAGSELDLDGFFGLNPALAPLLPLYQSEQLAFLHATGSPDPTRSHFDAQDFMETAAPGDKSVREGWLNRLLGEVAGGERIAGIALNHAAPFSLRGPAPTLAFRSLAEFQVGGLHPELRRDALQQLYTGQESSLIGSSTLGALDTVELVQSVDTTTTAPYPGSALGTALRDAAALIKADLGACVVTIDVGGWDHHSDMAPRLAALGGDLAGSLAAFHEDLGTHANRTLALCVTEFGRRAAENGSAGADHGHGGIMVALGGGVRGGRVLLRDGVWPGLGPGDLWNGQDLAVTTDYRDVFAEILARHMGVPAATPILPAFTVDADRYPGLFA